MTTLQRSSQNPILSPNPKNEWEAVGAFNGCVAYADGVYHMVYRALSSPKNQNGVTMEVSSIGYAHSRDGVHFSGHRQLIEPTEDWEMYGSEDPRITYMDGKFYIFYTALSVYPFAAYGIKTAVAITKDFKTFEKHPVTTFNSKAMALFPERINGKLAALLTINTDMPPAKLCFASFEREEDIYSPFYWTEWYAKANAHAVHLLRDMRDQVELGAPPIKTADGWLVMYSYIKNYLSDEKIFGIEAVLLSLEDPRRILGRTEEPLITPVEPYELEGIVPNVIFPSGALIKDNELHVYYGGADTTTAVATCSVGELLSDLKPQKEKSPAKRVDTQMFVRFEGNPILTPAPELSWQAMAVFNPAVIYLNGKVHILYRSQSADGTSYVGYASSSDGLRIDENLTEPIYGPRADFEKKTHDQGNSGCEDPRITKIGDRIYMTYTAYDGVNPPRSARNWEVLASIYRNITGVAQNALAFSLDAYGRAIQRDPLNPALRLNVGGIYYSVKNYDLAIRFFSDAANLKPDYVNAYYNLSIALRDKGDLENAGAVAEQTVALLQKNKNSEDYKAATKLLDELKAKIATGQKGTAGQPSNALEGTNVDVSNLNNPPEVATPAAVQQNPAARLPQLSPTPQPTQ